MHPQFDNAFYRCYVNGGFFFKKYHLSGILVFKNLTHAERRIVFTNEMGYSFFDFGWYTTPYKSSTDGHPLRDSFVVHSIIPQLNRGGVIRTLRKDLELFLGDTEGNGLFELGDLRYRRVMVRADNSTAWLVSRDQSLLRMELAGKRRPVTTIYPIYLDKARTGRDMPDSVSIVHHRARFIISAKKYVPDAE